MKDEDRFNRIWQSETITGTTTETSSCLLGRGSKIGKRLGGTRRRPPGHRKLTPIQKKIIKNIYTNPLLTVEALFKDVSYFREKMQKNTTTCNLNTMIKQNQFLLMIIDSV
jgi:hypothetical protein